MAPNTSAQLPLWFFSVLFSSHLASPQKGSDYPDHSLDEALNQTKALRERVSLNTCVCSGLRLIAEVNVFQRRTRFTFSLFSLRGLRCVPNGLTEEHSTVNLCGERCNLCLRDSAKQSLS